MNRRLIPLLATLLLSLPASAHIGSPDTFVQRNAGPYPLLLSLHPPSVYPGALELDLRANPDDHLTAATAAFDTNAPANIQLFADGTAIASLWTDSPSSHTLHIAVQGSHGPATLDIDLPATNLPRPDTTHRWPLILIVLTLFVIAISGFDRTRPKLNANSSTRQKRKAFISFAILLASLLLLGFAYILPAKRHLYTTVAATLSPTGVLDLRLINGKESFNNLVPDHGKLLHLFLIRQPDSDVFLHLHPQQLSPGHFIEQLPAMPGGTYQLFADFYHSDGSGETATLALDLPPQFHTASTQDPDDSTAVLPPIPAAAPSSSDQVARLPDGYTLQLHTDPNLHPLHAHILQVTLLDPSGRPPDDMALYLGMPAHAVVLATKVTTRADTPFIFAHIHPGGTLPMLTPSDQIGTNMPGMDMSMPMTTPTNTAAIPYGFPIPGEYRLFVQMKHGRIIETAAFDLHVGNR
ncbi:MAG: hypothetical protein V4555_14385 [Acidobacteriota bacterium]